MHTLLTPPKPHQTYTELVRRLKERGMIIPDEERAKRKLSQIGYYRLSGFWYPCRKGKIDANGSYVTDEATNRPIRADELQKDTSFDDVIQLYLFDKKLRQLMLDAIERIEIHVRSVIAHEIGRFDPLAYQNTDFINPKILKDRTDRHGNARNFWQEWHNKQQELTLKSKEDCIAWHKSKNRSIPIWVAVETWDFGIMSKYFTNLKGRYQNIICKRLNVPNEKVLAGWLQAINDLRNHCAHHSRVWNRVASNALKVMDNPYFNNLSLDQNARTRIFGQICILWYLVKRIGPNSDWITRVADTVDSKPKTPCFPFKAMGLPDETGFPRDKF